MSESGISTFKRALACTLVVACVGLLGACRSMMGGGDACHKPGAYVEAKDAPPLKIPPGFKAPDTAQALRIPALNEPAAPPRSKGDPCLDEPPPYSTPKPAPQPAA